MYIFKSTTALSWDTSPFQPHKHNNNTAFSHYTTLFKAAVSAETLKASPLLQACSQRYKLKTPNKQLGTPTEHLTVVSTLYTFSQTERFYCVTSYLTDKTE
jgi:hypothetical protein